MAKRVPGAKRLVPGVGIEPTWCCHRGILSPVRLPIPPSRRGAASLNDNRGVRLADFDYELPPELIAQHPAPQRTASRLLHVDGKTGSLEDLQFRDIASLIEAGDVLVVNDTRVIKARLHGRKDTGGEGELLVEPVLDAHPAPPHLPPRHPPNPPRKGTAPPTPRPAGI